MSSSEKTQADFDLERFIDMFDEALTSNDERVVNALRSLMMMVILTKSEERKNADIGPLRQIFEDMHQLNRNFHDVSERLRRLENETRSDKSYHARDYWDRQNRWNLAEPMSLPTMSEEEYKRVALAIHNINTPGKKV
jgi:hypothetical protein